MNELSDFIYIFVMLPKNLFNLYCSTKLSQFSDIAKLLTVYYFSEIYKDI